MNRSTRPLGFILAAAAITSALAVEELPIPKITEDNPAAVAPSPVVSNRIISGLPKYTPLSGAAPATKANTPGGPGGAADDDLFNLPTMIVRQKPRPRLTEDIVFKNKKDYGAVFAKENYSQLDQALNKYTLPLFGTSLEARAYDDFHRMKNAQMQEDVNSLSKAVEAIDPAEAKALRETMAKP